MRDSKQKYFAARYICCDLELDIQELGLQAGQRLIIDTQQNISGSEMAAWKLVGSDVISFRPADAGKAEGWVLLGGLVFGPSEGVGHDERH
ncbi:hypothetical protein HPT27_10475 [Permianibacter sp. IMCC34836]|uniref:hypothetical protein n=1 Tax=Permianibacter fluminis TaxID=2738515 RepID=UPI00155392E0|nr:hypothetical protein [Permianibacter fluminis]NQD37453.1 hypothetical protein [Permianibacter fluminis]